MNRFAICLFVIAIATASACVSSDSASAKPNELSSVDKRDGWELLFDGRSLAGWRNYKKADAPKQGWVVEDGCLRLQKKSGGGDIITLRKFTDYDLRWEWKIPAMANNGLKYLVREDRAAPGPEYQMIDDAVDEPANRTTASLYDILPRTKNMPTLIGEWNRSRILVKGNEVQHWLNGEKVLEYKLGSPELKAALAQSKFNPITNFGDKIEGHILLTDHNDEVSYRNVKIRELSPR